MLCCLGSTLYTCHSVSLGLGRVYVRSALKSLSDAALGLFLLRVSQRLSVYMESEGSTPPALSPLWDLPHTLLLLAPLFLVPLCKKMGFFQGSSCLHYLTSTHLGLPLGRISGSKEETLGGGLPHTPQPAGPPLPRPLLESLPQRWPHSSRGWGHPWVKPGRKKEENHP